MFILCSHCSYISPFFVESLRRIVLIGNEFVRLITHKTTFERLEFYMTNENNNGKHKGHQDPQPDHGNDHKGHNGGQPPRVSVNPGKSHSLLK